MTVHPHSPVDEYHYCRHGHSHDTNELHNLHVTEVLAKITSARSNFGWVLRRMKLDELCFMSELLGAYGPDAIEIVRQALQDELLGKSGAFEHSRAIIMTQTVIAPVAAPLAFSENGLRLSVIESFHTKHRSVIPIPYDCDSISDLPTHVASQRGAFLALMIHGNLIAPHDDWRKLIWMGENYKEILPHFSKLQSWNSSDRDLIEDLISGSNALSEGVL